MKIRRQDSQEDYKITAPWLYEFAHTLEKEADHLDYLRQYFESRRRQSYNTIDEKMADIKQRVGFDLARKISEELDSSSAISKDSSIDNTYIKNAEYQFPQKEIDIMSNILQYAQDMIKHEPHLDPHIILSRLREEDNLRINEIRLNVAKFLDFLQSQIDEHNSQNDTELITYIPQSPVELGDIQDREADYYSHSKPNST